MLSFHDFRTHQHEHIKLDHLNALTTWQSDRLTNTHHDLYQHPDYHRGVRFLFDELYSPQDFSDRDQDLERIFPKLIKFLPASILDTVATLVELNLLTQSLDIELAMALPELAENQAINAEIYCEAYRACDNQELRAQQLKLIEEVGLNLDRYARSKTILYSLKLSKGPAEMAGLSALHNFIHRGFKAFHEMKNVKTLMSTLISREQEILARIYMKHASPFNLGSPT